MGGPHDDGEGAAYGMRGDGPSDPCRRAGVAVEDLARVPGPVDRGHGTGARLGADERPPRECQDVLAGGGAVADEPLLSAYSITEAILPSRTV